MSHCGSANPKTILVVSQVFINFGPDPVQYHSVECLSHNGTEADFSIVSSLAKVPCFWYWDNVQN